MRHLRTIAQGVIVPLMTFILWPACTLCTGGTVPDTIFAENPAADMPESPSDATTPSYSVAVWVAGYWMPVDEGYLWVPLNPGEYLPWAYDSTAEAGEGIPGWI